MLFVSRGSLTQLRSSNVSLMCPHRYHTTQHNIPWPEEEAIFFCIGGVFIVMILMKAPTVALARMPVSAARPTSYEGPE